MSIGLVGRKVGMTRIFTDDGDSVPVTVVDVSNNRVAQVKSVENDGYSAVQVVFGSRRASRVIKPAAGHFAKAGVQAGTALKEFRLAAPVADDIKPGSVIDVDLFKVGQLVFKEKPAVAAPVFNARLELFKLYPRNEVVLAFHNAAAFVQSDITQCIGPLVNCGSSL